MYGHFKARNLLQLAYEQALKSTNQVTQNGAVLWSSEFGLVGEGYTHQPDGCGYELPAAVDCVLSAARHGVAVEGSTLVCPLVPETLQCVAVLANAGVSWVVCHVQACERLELDVDQLAAAGLKVNAFDGYVFKPNDPKGFEIRMGGESWRP